MSFLPLARRQVAPLARRFASTASHEATKASLVTPTKAMLKAHKSPLSKVMPVEIYPLLAAIGVMSCIAATTIYVTLNKGDLRLFPQRFGASGFDKQDAEKKEVWEE